MIGQNLAKREKLLVAVCIILGASAIGYNMVVGPIAAGWKARNNEIQARINLLNKNTKLLGMSDRLRAEYLKYRDYIELGQSEQEELRAALEEIENLSKKTSCRIANIKPRAARKIGNYKEISFVIISEGNIEALSRFLHAIEGSKKLLRVKHFSITPKSTSSGNLKATFLISKIIFR
ncbi:MAG: type 4a pilus biogenesis protein PilO [Omnitrophica bacterium]|nr:type 4a pilus biogenesis protein PilO [Candidatus Omnitrophota bacterium]